MFLLLGLQRFSSSSPIFDHRNHDRFGRSAMFKGSARDHRPFADNLSKDLKIVRGGCQ